MGLWKSHDARVLDNEITEIAASINDSGEHVQCGHDREAKFSRRSPVVVAPYTGAAVKFMGDISYWDRSVILDCREAFLDAHAEIECEEEDEDDSNDESVHNRVKNQSLATLPSVVALEGMTGNDIGALHECAHCSRRFRYENHLRHHQEIFNVGRNGVTVQ